MRTPSIERNGGVIPSIVCRTSRHRGLTEQSLERPALGPGNGAAETVGDDGLRVEAEGVVDGGGEVGRADGAIGREGADGITRAVDGTASNAAAGENGGIAAGPMFATGVDDLGRPAELADPDDQRLVRQTAVGK